MKKIVLTLTVSFVAAALLGAVGYVIAATYGGRHGCFPLVDQIFNSQGFDSCGPFGELLGGIAGLLVGSVVSCRFVLKK